MLQNRTNLKCSHGHFIINHHYFRSDSSPKSVIRLFWQSRP